ncbi:Gfo/Idh/MocA family protein [Humibacter ginsenosidimutans]|uniref:Gfo/Idh/MocA family oxidoreductase n=1 Tax=Humibacter ginsenosidimutans TaxID=2599293 RepID=A0A5B8M839_9MICO|nr:Gfo/Idh/MocA family oxidoreductase [Humibacter ginsenosidimutans]QDZ15835.1 Gfo/Idh/MocA family oxidoreductase [Humibacter ginsenosidimutans]
MNQTVGLIGAGGIANAHLPAWLDLGFDVLVYSVTDDAPRLVQRHGGGRVVESLDELLEGVDLVDVCAPTSVHSSLAMEALRHRLPTICEKPLARTLQDAESLAEAFGRAEVPLFPAHVVRYFPDYVALHGAIESGALGDIGVQRFTRQGQSPKNGWYLDRQKSGGVLLDLMIHDIDVARWTAGDVVRVFARTRSHQGNESTQAILTHASGAISQLTATWTTAPIEFRTQFDVSGSRGTLRSDSATRPTYTRVGIPSDADDILPDFDPATNPYRAELADFVRAIDEGFDARVTARDGVEAIRIADAVARSAGSGRAIELTTNEEEVSAA